MPRRAVLPTADEFFTKIYDKGLPPWSAVGTVELARLLGVHQQTLWNRSVRGQMPPAEEPGLYRRTGNRKLYRIDAVLGWLPGGDGPAPWDWARRYLGSAWHIPPEHLDD